MGHAELIQALGGGTAVAKRLSEMTGKPVDREIVYKWREFDRIPWRWRGHLIAIAKEQRQRLPPEFLPGVVV